MVESPLQQSAGKAESLLSKSILVFHVPGHSDDHLLTRAREQVGSCFNLPRGIQGGRSTGTAGREQDAAPEATRRQGKESC